jgi:hypothetical protein
MTLQEQHLTPEETLSPYLPNYTYPIRMGQHQHRLSQNLPPLYQYIMIEGWGSRDESIHLRFGIEYHTALQDYAISRAKGITHEDAVHDTVRSLHLRIYSWDPDRNSRAGKYKNRETLVGLVIDYLDHFSDDPAETYILKNGAPAVELSFRFELDWGPQSSTKIPNGHYILNPISSPGISTELSPSTTISTLWTAKPHSQPYPAITLINGPPTTK